MARLLQAVVGAAIVILIYYAIHTFRGSRDWQDRAYRDYILQSDR